MKKLLSSILVSCLLLGGNAYAKPTSEYLGNDVWLIKLDNGCTYKGGAKGSGKKKGIIFKYHSDSARHGYGVDECPTGAYREGQFVNDNFVSGIYVASSGNRYEGQFVNDSQLHGEGIAYYKSGHIFEGTWENGNQISGKQKYPDGDIWIGKFTKQGNKYYLEGKGSNYIKNNKVRWEGIFALGLIDGKAKLFYDDGSIREADCDKKTGKCTNYTWIKSPASIEGAKQEKKEAKSLYDKIYNKCILENLKGQTDKEAIKIVKDVCKNKAENPSLLDKLFN